ncbi:MAG: tetratricopeptide repeat protein [Bacteroidetes bacterium]|nr:tetratricopeptide repeat protein [Bacteroidota bacterium]MBS1739576.1 tetratricopeptide repeat protein [Bacteroidota bacterium]MBS1776526.1 tetratricopeptide repeat protein [Bacteroidota bacterium]
MANTVRNKSTLPNSLSNDDSNALENIQLKYEQHKKRINTVISVILAAIVAFFAYKKFILEPKENKAANAISFAQSLFAADSLNLALNGDGQHLGFAKIAKKYSGTKAGNLANYYAGVCYLQLHDAPNAIKFLKEFDGKGTKLQYAADGILGDAYMENNNAKEGINYYEKATADKTDNLITPLYLYRAALAYEQSNQADKAKTNYKKIRDEYPQSMQAREVDKNLARLGVID